MWTRLVSTILLSLMLLVGERAFAYYRQPALSPTGKSIAFSYDGDIWQVAAHGGSARILTSHPAYEWRPIYSPNGRWIVFSSDRTGNGDLYAVSLVGDEMRRLTYGDQEDYATGWSPDSKWIYFESRRDDISYGSDLYRVSVDGGTPVQLTEDKFEAEFAAVASPDGKTLAFNSGQFIRQWWRRGPYLGDEADVWTLTWKKGKPVYKKITKYRGRNAWPMWNKLGNGIYYVSDRGGTENIWYIDLTTKKLTKVTKFTDGRTLFAKMSPDHKWIVFERKFGIWKLNLATRQASKVPIKTISDKKRNHKWRWRTSSKFNSLMVAPDGKKVAFTSRGEVFAASVEDAGEARRLTNTSQRECCTYWSPDSESLVYSSDRNGAYDLYRYNFKKQQEELLYRSKLDSIYPVYSPDGKWIAFQEGDESLRVLDVKSRNVKEVARGFFTSFPLMGVRPHDWSPDSKWIAYLSSGAGGYTNVFARKLDEKRPVQLTYLPNIDHYTIRWSPDGKSILFGSASIRFEFQVKRLFLHHVEAYFKEKEFDELFKGSKADDGDKDKKDKSEKDEKIEPVKIELEGIKDRLANLLPAAHNVRYAVPSPDKKHIAFVSTMTGSKNIWLLKMNDDYGIDNVRQVTSTSGEKHHLTFDKKGKKLYFTDGGKAYSVSVAKGSPKNLGIEAIVNVDFDKEKMQAFREVQRNIQRYFYDQSFGGKDWQKITRAYEPYIAKARNRRDLHHMLNLMLGELNASHMGVRVGYRRDSTGRLGIEFDKNALVREGSVRLKRVTKHGPLWKIAKPGEYIVAIDGEPVTKNVDFDALLEHKIGKRVEVRLAKNAKGGSSRNVYARPTNDALVRHWRYVEWVDGNARLVDRLSNGRLGYLHIPGMGRHEIEGFQNALDTEVRGREGVVIDVRNSLGGFSATFMIDVLIRKKVSETVWRNIRSASAQAAGNTLLEIPTIMVQNERTISNGEMFSEAYRRLKLGKIVGTPSSSWVIWTWGTQLIDGAHLRLPMSAVVSLDGKDIERSARPVDVYQGRPLGETARGIDSQLKKTVEVMLKQLGPKKKSN